jgi:general secretion pathway protein G
MRKGFTLIELLVVITILAVLAGAALPYVQNYVEEARIAKAKTDLEEIARALAVYETREGEYEADTVKDLTGRYLNKAPIDPWGSEYKISTDAGTVYSLGPNRRDGGDDSYDNIVVSYQPPLALVSVKWVDKNQSGAVDIQNVSDELHLTFSRKFGDTITAGLADICTKIYNDQDAELSTIVEATPSIVASKVLVYRVKTAGGFAPGQSYLVVTNSHGVIFDRANPKNYCLAGQNVRILPQ